MIKKFASFLLATTLLIGACGCMNNVSTTRRESKITQKIETYLSEKYGTQFVYIGKGDDVWSSKSKSYIFADMDNRQLIVKDTDGYFADNYGSSVYDVLASECFSQESNMESKIFINTQSVFFGFGKKFNGYKDYLCECPVVNVAVYVVGDCDWDIIAEKLKCLLGDCTVSAIVYNVDANTYNSLEHFGTTSNILSFASFWIEDNTISEKSWEE